MDGSSPVTLTQLYNFRKLAKTEHMTQAAKELYITQPTLSLSIKALERELGVPLFYRDGRNIKLTKYGQEFYDGIEPMLEKLESTVEATRAHGNTLNGSLDIGTIPTIQYDFLPALLQRFWEANGYDVKLRFTVEFTLPLVRGLKAQHYDLIFGSYAPGEPGIDFLPMLSSDLVAVVRADSPFAEQESFSLADLRGRPFVSYNAETPIGDEVREAFADYGIEPTAGFDDEFTLTSFVVAHDDMPGIMTRTFEIDTFRNVKILPIDGIPKGFHTIYLAYDKQIFRRKIMNDFIETAIEFARERREEPDLAGAGSIPPPPPA